MGKPCNISPVSNLYFDVNSYYGIYCSTGIFSKSILFNNVRVLEEYSGVDASQDIKKVEIDKAIDKFSMNIPVKK